MAALGERGVFNPYSSEGGGTLAGSLMDAGLADKIIAFIAPTIIGGKAAPSPIAGAGAERMRDALRLTNVQIRRFGNDVAILGDASDIRRAFRGE